MRPSSSRSEPASSSRTAAAARCPATRRSTRWSATGPGCGRCSTSRPRSAAACGRGGRWPRPPPREVDRPGRRLRATTTPTSWCAAAADVGQPGGAAGGRLTRDVAAQDEDAARWVHLGATSQDILDTAADAGGRRGARGRCCADLDRGADAAARLADAGTATTLMAGRTLGQQAAPTTFGLTAAGWLTGLDAAAAPAAREARRGSPVQLGGAGRAPAWPGARGCPSSLAAFAAASSGWPSRRCPGTPTGSPVVELAGALGAGRWPRARRSPPTS